MILKVNTAPKSSIRNATATTSVYAPSSPIKVHIDKPTFTMDLPAGWTEDTSPRAGYTRQGYNFLSAPSEIRALTVFIDDIPANKAVNKAVLVSAKGAGLDYGDVSDNCVTYTHPSRNDVTTGYAAALWKGAAFLCDTGNYQRDVAGTVSMDGLNYVLLTGPTTGKHHVFITYTDNSLSPDYTALYSILGSFQVK